jgi:4-amino-4-deoxy-L-arabinose transferase-like glycosyltransferase
MAQAQGVLGALARPAALFVVALGVRLAYLAWQGTAPVAAFHPDTPIFLGIAASPAWWAGTAERLPGYPIFLALHFAVFGSEAYWAPLVSQAAIDAAACVAIARTAELLRPGAGRWAGPLAAFNPSQIVMAGVLLGDSIFVGCLAFGFLALGRWWRQEGGAIAIGFWFGLALFNRAVLWPFVPVLGLAMLAAGGRRGDWRAAPVALALIALFAAPIAARNWAETGSFALSSQGPMHMALWWYPLVREAHDGTPYARSVGEVTAAFRAAGGGAGGFADAEIYRAIARAGLAELPPSAYAKAWAMGAAINLASPATLMIPSVMALPRTGFYATPGETPSAKIANFLTESSSALYLGWLALGAALEWPVRLLALAGIWFAWRARRNRAAALFALAWIGFVLVVQGPVASAKYRLPVEPIVMALAGTALVRRDRIAPVAA